MCHGSIFARNITTLKNTPTPLFVELLKFIALGRFFFWEITLHLYNFWMYRIDTWSQHILNKVYSADEVSEWRHVWQNFIVHLINTQQAAWGTKNYWMNFTNPTKHILYDPPSVSHEWNPPSQCPCYGVMGIVDTLYTHHVQNRHNKTRSHVYSKWSIQYRRGQMSEYLFFNTAQ